MKNAMLENIYENARMNFPLTKIIEATITEEIDNILKQQKPAMSSQDLEELLNLLFEVSDISEKQGFVLGFRYAVALMNES